MAGRFALAGSVTAAFVLGTVLSDHLPSTFGYLLALASGALGFASLIGWWAAVRLTRLAAPRPPSEAVETFAVLASASILLAVYFLRAGLRVPGLLLLLLCAVVTLVTTAVWVTRVSIPDWIWRPPQDRPRLGG